MIRDSYDDRPVRNDRRTFLKRLTSGIVGGSLLAGASRIPGQEKKAPSKSPGQGTRPLSITDSTPLIGQVCLFGFNFAPSGWAQCNGQLLPISQYTALFSVLGTMYGGDGITTFALPNLQALIPIGAGSGPGLTTRTTGSTGGSEYVALTNANIPSHTHAMAAASGNGTANGPQGNFFATNAEGIGQFNASSDTSLSASTLSAAGGELPHYNMPPYLVLNYCIALNGVFPTRSGSGSSPDELLGDVMLFAGNFVPDGYLACDGSLLSIGANTALFSLLGTTYGGDGINTFGLPDLRGRAPMHMSTSHIIGESSGTETVTLITNEIPSHNHQMRVSSGTGTSVNPGNNYVAANLEGVPQFSGSADGTMNGNVVGSDGGSSPHENMPPFLAMTYCISSVGVFPSRS